MELLLFLFVLVIVKQTLYSPLIYIASVAPKVSSIVTGMNQYFSKSTADRVAAVVELSSSRHVVV